mmetsp:Transcript_18529/g.21284  ORF Transcript_18529/g.21284 Transcript_18529/m.21284 type:complete len:85 (+) Transcript_18529:31-285(+)
MISLVKNNKGLNSHTNHNINAVMSQTLGNMIYNNLKQEISLNHSKADGLSFSADHSQGLDVADLLLYRGEKYKENRLKLKEELN